MGAGHDTGELTTAALTLGVPHPPGYPLFTHVGHAFAVAFPFGDPGWRINLLSAIWVALAGACLCDGLLRLTRCLFAGTSAAFAFCFAVSVWRQAVVGEVFALHLFLLAMLFWSMSVWETQPERRPWMANLNALLLGLGAAHQHVLVLALPGLLAWAFRVERDPRRWGVRWWGVLLALAVPGGLYADLAWRSSQHPHMNWGDPSNFERLSHHFLRKTYGTLRLNSSEGGLDMAWAHIVAYTFAWVGYQFPVPLTPLPLLAPLRNRSPACLGLALWMLAFGPFFSILGRQPTVGFYVDLQERFYASSYFGAAGLLGLTVAWLCAGRFRLPWGALLVLGCGLSAVRNYPFASQYGQYQPRDTLAAMMQECEPGSVLVLGGDLTAGVGEYLQQVEGMRPDLVLIYPGLIGAPWFQVRLPAHLLQAARRGGPDHEGTLEAIVREQTREGGAVYYNDRPTLGGAAYRRGLVWRWWPQEQPQPGGDEERQQFRAAYLRMLACPLRGETQIHGWQGFWSRYMLSAWAESHKWAVRLLRRNSPRVAALAQQRMLEIVPARPLDDCNLGLLWLDGGRFALAREALDRALALQSDYRVALAAQVALARARGDHEEESRWLLRLGKSQAQQQKN